MVRGLAWWVFASPLTLKIGKGTFSTSLWIGHPGVQVASGFIWIRQGERSVHYLLPKYPEPQLSSG